jgi:large subunit ribosomal protein L5
MSEAGQQDKAPKSKKAQKAEAKAQGNAVATGEQQRDPNYTPRFKKRYNDVVKPELMKKFGYKNAMQVPKINKIVLNIGAGEGAADSKKIQQAQNDLTAIAGQKAQVTRAKKAIASSRSPPAAPSAPRSRCARTRCTSFSIVSSPSRCRAFATSAG